MPTYRYRCLACKKTFERVETMSAHQSGPVRCPKCRSVKVARVFTAPFVKTTKKS